MKVFGKQNGQVLVEFIISSVALTVLTVGLMYFGRFIITNQKVISINRYKTFCKFRNTTFQKNLFKIHPNETLDYSKSFKTFFKIKLPPNSDTLPSYFSVYETYYLPKFSL